MVERISFRYPRSSNTEVGKKVLEKVKGVVTRSGSDADVNYVSGTIGLREDDPNWDHTEVDVILSDGGVWNVNLQTKRDDRSEGGWKIASWGKEDCMPETYSAQVRYSNTTLLSSPTVRSWGGVNPGTFLLCKG